MQTQFERNRLSTESDPAPSEPIQAHATINAALTALSSVVQHHGLDKDGTVLPALTKLRERSVREDVRLAVLGEFSAGKTTFINTLLGTSLLQTGILPTTATCTYISYGPELNCEVTFKDGHVVRLPPEQIGTFSSEGARSTEVREVTLTLPLPLLANGLVIVDTPGVNVNLDAHEATTIQAIDEANASVYLMDARVPGNKTTIEFLRHIQRKVDKFFFVINRSDIWDSDQQREGSEYVSSILTQQCGIRNPRVVLLSSLLDQENSPVEWRERFAAFESSLRSFMQKDRESLIYADLARLLDDAIVRSEHLLESKCRIIERELAAHHRIELPDSEGIIFAWREECDSMVKADIDELEGRFLEWHISVFPKMREHVERCLSSAKTVEALVTLVPQEIQAAFDSVENERRKSLADSFEAIYSSRHNQVAASVKALFSGVRMLEQKAVIYRISLWVSISLGVALVLGLESYFGATFTHLAMAPLLGACLAIVLYGMYYWAHNRSSLSTPAISHVTHADQVHDRIARGALVKTAVTDLRNPNLSLGESFSLLVKKFLFVWPSTVREEIRKRITPLIDEFERATRERGLADIAAGRQAITSSLTTFLDKSIESHQIVLDRLAKVHAAVKDGIEKRRLDVSADVDSLRALHQQVLDALGLLEMKLKDVSAPYVADAKDSDKARPTRALRNEKTLTATTLPHMASVAESYSPNKSLTFFWLGALAISIILGLATLSSVFSLGR